SISLVDVPSEPPGAPSPVRVFGGVYSPRAGRFEVAIREPGAIAGSFAQANPSAISPSTSEYTSVGGAHPSVTLAIPIWSMAGVDLDTTTDEPAPFLVDVGNDGKIHVTNTSGRAIDWVGLLYSGRVIDGGRLDPGRDVKISRK